MPHKLGQPHNLSLFLMNTHTHTHTHTQQMSCRNLSQDNSMMQLAVKGAVLLKQREKRHLTHCLCLGPRSVGVYFWSIQKSSELWLAVNPPPPQKTPNPILLLFGAALITGVACHSFFRSTSGSLGNGSGQYPQFPLLWLIAWYGSIPLPDFDWLIVCVCVCVSLCVWGREIFQGLNVDTWWLLQFGVKCGISKLYY